MRGLMGFLFPKAMYPMAKMLTAAEYDVMMASWQPNYVSNIYEDITTRWRRSKDYKFVILGHSLGGNSGTSLSQKLAAAGVPIHYLGIIDAPMPKHIGKTTLICDNFYQFNDFRDPILTADSKNTVLTQYNFRRKDDKTGIYVESEDHVGLASNPFVVSKIMEQIENL